MIQHPGDLDELRAATLCGTTAAVASICHRDLRECAVAYPELFPDNPFDVTLFNAITLANAFGSPWLTPDRLRIANRTTLWIFAVDWLIDYVADSRDKVDTLVRRSLEVADGASPDSPLTHFLADIRDELATAPAYPGLRLLWRDELQRVLVASVREWEWKSVRATGEATDVPTLDQYLGNADNFGSTFVNLSHWISVGDPAALDHLDELRMVSGEIQRVLRLLNDLATYERDIAWGDLNVQMLGLSREDVLAQIAVLVDDCRKLLEPLRDSCSREADYLERQIGYSMGFYGITDYWGQL